MCEEERAACASHIALSGSLPASWCSPSSSRSAISAEHSVASTPCSVLLAAFLLTEHRDARPPGAGADAAHTPADPGSGLGDDRKGQSVGARPEDGGDSTVNLILWPGPHNLSHSVLPPFLSSKLLNFQN